MEKTERILVVDDEIVIRELMCDILAEEGYDVVPAQHGKAALDLITNEGNFVVLFTDIMMPEMDGIELIREARKVAPTLVPIVMTGYATLETARAAVKEGAYDYVLKPFNLSEIKLAVNNALDRFRLSNEIARLREITELFNISERIAAIRNEEQLLDFVLEAALARVNATRGSVMVVQPDGRKLEVVKSMGVAPGSSQQLVDMEGTISGWVATNVKPLLINDIENAPEFQAMGHGLETRSFISVPLEHKASPTDEMTITEHDMPKVLAVINITGKRDGTEFTEGDLKTLSVVANHAAAALENARLLQDIEDGQREIVFTLGEIVETRSRETGNHVKRVAEYSKVLAKHYGLPHAETEVLRLASPLHDVGKVGIPDAVLNKPGKLTPEEFDVIKTHSQLGYDMLKVTKGRVLQSAAIIALQHHEKWNGKGYPNALVGEEIHIYGRITGVADVFDALGVERVYKPAWELDRILGLFKEERGQHFDPHIVDIFFENLDELLTIRDAFPE